MALPTPPPWPPDDVPPWLPVLPPLLGRPGERSAEATLAVLAQFPLATAKRYAPTRDAKGGLTTWCNVFVSDATAALGCEIPHWIDAAGNKAPVGRGWELGASGFERYLQRHADWHRCLPDEAAQQARAGFPVVATWYNPRGHGHVAMVLPTSTAAELRIAQAGATNLWDRPIREGFGYHAGECLFWWHD